jgi:predicted membrane chloride channel (bestrophin family)
MKWTKAAPFILLSLCLFIPWAYSATETDSVASLITVAGVIIITLGAFLALRNNAGSGRYGSRHGDYSRIERWIKVNYGFEVKEKAKTGRLYELDSVYSHELGKQVPEKRLRGLQAYIKAQKNKKMIR